VKDKLWTKLSKKDSQWLPTRAVAEYDLTGRLEKCLGYLRGFDG
jgi:hypothetical protein